VVPPSEMPPAPSQGAGQGQEGSAPGHARRQSETRRSLVRWWEGWKDQAEEFVVDTRFDRFK
jgi:hypothetical protein